MLSNHYHFVAHIPQNTNGAESLREAVRKLHSLTTKELNRRENVPGRTRLWQNFRETHLTHQASYLARLHYVHQNAFIMAWWPRDRTGNGVAPCVSRRKYPRLG